MINLALSDSFRTAFPKKPDFVFQLYTGERKKGNIMTSMNQTAKHYIMEQFEKKSLREDIPIGIFSRTSTTTVRKNTRSIGS